VLHDHRYLTQAATYFYLTLSLQCGTYCVSLSTTRGGRVIVSLSLFNNVNMRVNPFAFHHQQFRRVVVSLSTVNSADMRVYPYFYRQQCGHEGVSLTAVRSVDVEDISLSTSCSVSLSFSCCMDMQGLSIYSTPSSLCTCWVYPSLP
jgi:hypothetical protein